MSNFIDETLRDLNYQSLYHMAEWHDKQSTMLRTRAHDLQKREHMHNQVDVFNELLRSTPKTVMKYLRQGHSVERSQQLTAEHTNIRMETIRARWKGFLDDKSKKATKARNLLILELHGLGLTNVNIAERLNLHPVSVCRILKKEKSKRIYHPNPERIALFSQKKESVPPPPADQLRKVE